MHVGAPPPSDQTMARGLIVRLSVGALGLMVGLIVSVIASRRAQAPERAP